MSLNPLESKWKRVAVFSAIVAAGGGYVLLNAVLPSHLHCIFKSLTGVPCPGCGMVRALSLLFQGDIVGSLLLNPVGIVVFAFLLFIGVCVFADAFWGTAYYDRCFKRPWPWPVVLAAVALTAANWVWNICKGL